MRREFITKSTSGGCGQFETSPEEIEQEMLTALCERRQTDRLKTNYRVDSSLCKLFQSICDATVKHLVTMRHGDRCLLKTWFRHSGRVYIVGVKGEPGSDSATGRDGAPGRDGRDGLPGFNVRLCVRVRTSLRSTFRRHCRPS